MSCVSLSSAAFPFNDPASRPVTPAERLASRTNGALSPGLVSSQVEGSLSSPLARVCTMERDGKTSSSSRNCNEVSETISNGTSLQNKSRKRTLFWQGLPQEIKMSILAYLPARDIVRSSTVSKAWHAMCFDGQLWSCLDTTDYYSSISADTLVRIITSGGPFINVLNLKGCVQFMQHWSNRRLVGVCRNLEYLSLEGCRIDRVSLHCFLLQNSKLKHINLSGLAGATNSAMKIIAQSCAQVEHLNVSWCNNINTEGLRRVIEGCPNLRDLRAGETRGWDDEDFVLEIFRKNTLEHLSLVKCEGLNDETLSILIKGRNPEIDFSTGHAKIPPRALKLLDLTQCRAITDDGISALAHHLPYLEGLRLAKCRHLTDDSLIAILPTLKSLTHLDLEELEDLTNATLLCLADSAARLTLRHLCISYCENMGDAGMLPLLNACPRLANLEMDNTRISDLVLIEAADLNREIRRRQLAGLANRTEDKTPDGKLKYKAGPFPLASLHMEVYDCANVTWTGIREVLSCNAEVIRPRPCRTSRVKMVEPLVESVSGSDDDGSDANNTVHNNKDDGGNENVNSSPTVNAAVDNCTTHSLNSQDLFISPPAPSSPSLSATYYPHALVTLKCFFHWQATVNEHTKRCLRGDFASAARLERKWADWMMLNEEANVGGAGSRRRRRRAREAELLSADEQAGGGGSGALSGLGGMLGGTGNSNGGGNGIGILESVGRRRRARSGGCAVM